MPGRRLLSSLVCVVLLTGGCAGTDPDAEETVPMEAITFPDPVAGQTVSVEEALARRRSVRSFDDEPLTTDELGRLFWSAQGITEVGGGRTNPSAGGTYPLEVYAVTGDGLFHYLPGGHRAEVLGREDLRAWLAAAALDQEAVREAPATFVICAVLARTGAVYGDRAVRYVHLEAGHVGQSLLLQAVAMGLGAVPIGAFRDADVAAVLGLPADCEPLYLIPVGHPAG